MTPQDPEGTRDRVKKAIDAHWRKYHVAPSVRDIVYCARLKSNSHAYKILNALEMDGAIMPRDGGIARNIIPTWVAKAIDGASALEQGRA